MHQTDTLDGAASVASLVARTRCIRRRRTKGRARRRPGRPPGPPRAGRLTTQAHPIREHRHADPPLLDWPPREAERTIRLARVRRQPCPPPCRMRCCHTIGGVRATRSLSCPPGAEAADALGELAGCRSASRGSRRTRRRGTSPRASSRRAVSATTGIRAVRSGSRGRERRRCRRCRVAAGRAGSRRGGRATASAIASAPVAPRASGVRRRLGRHGRA